ncbi:MAG: lipopolysaccharide heptosyltransferase II [Deltaproteobacteria bacterium]|nr:lipopolysaccharide heptosyltransferase II [Deltaproteobacteria bacterium]
MAKILVRGLNWLGDAVVSLPAILALHRARSQDDLYVISGPSTKDVYALAPGVKEAWPDRKGLRDRYRLVKSLKALEPKETVIFQNALSAAALAFLAGLPNRQGYARDGRSWLLNRAVPIKPKHRLAHEAFYYLGLLKGLGIPAPFSAPRLTLGPPGRPLAPPAGFAPPPGFLVALAPGAAYGEAKRYPAQDFAQIANILAKSLPIGVVVLGGPGEAAAAKATQSLLGPGVKCLNLAGRTTLPEVMAVLAQCQLLVANDSGLMHLAGALGLPTVALFGPTNPLATGPLGHKSLVLRVPALCSPCRHRQCPKPERVCFLGLTPLTAANKILKFIAPPSPRGPAAIFYQVGPQPGSSPSQAPDVPLKIVLGQHSYHGDLGDKGGLGDKGLGDKGFGDKGLGDKGLGQGDGPGGEAGQSPTIGPGDPGVGKTEFKAKTEAGPGLALKSLANAHAIPVSTGQSLDEAIEKAKSLSLNFADSFWLGEDLAFLDWGKKLGGLTVLLANEKRPETFRAALDQLPTVAAPDMATGLEWVADALAHRD